jgi:hypothetical protein
MIAETELSAVFARFRLVPQQDRRIVTNAFGNDMHETAGATRRLFLFLPAAACGFVRSKSLSDRADSRC